MVNRYLNHDEVRFICLDNSALFELLTEFMMENVKELFDIEDSTSVSFQMIFNRKSKRFLCAIMDAKDRRTLDLYEMEKEIGPTASSVYSDSRYAVLDATSFIKKEN